MTANPPEGLFCLVRDQLHDSLHSRTGFGAWRAMVPQGCGSFDSDKGGTAIIGADPASSTLGVGIETAGVDIKDVNREAHLRSADFIDTENYPVMGYLRAGSISPML
jgi:polyisoprenoid-binding protein YceI